MCICISVDNQITILELFHLIGQTFDQPERVKVDEVELREALGDSKRFA